MFMIDGKSVQYNTIQATIALRPTSFAKPKFLPTLTKNIKSIYVQLKFHLSKDMATASEILNIKSI